MKALPISDDFATQKHEELKKLAVILSLYSEKECNLCKLLSN